MRQDREYLKDFNAAVDRLQPTSRTIRCPRSNKNLHSLRRRFHFDTQQAWEINECEPDLRAAFAHIRQFQFDLYQTLLSESACLFVECGVLLATPIAGIRNPEIAHFQPQTGEPLRNVVSINHCHDHTPRLLRAQCNERLRQWLSLPLGIRTCFASFANPWRSSRLSSSLPQSSQRTATKNAKPNPRTIALRPLRILGVLRGEILLTAKLAPDCRQEHKAKPRTCFASFANPWRSSRLSSSLPQARKELPPRTQSQTHVPSETEPLLEPLLTLAAAGQASLRSLTLKEHGRSSIVLHQTVYPHKK